MIINTVAKFILVAIVAVARFSTVLGQFSPASAPGPAGEDCMTEVLSAADCLTFIQNDSNQTVPDKPCCPEVKSLVANHPACLCQLIGQAQEYNVNLSRALQLPTVCKVKIPSLSLCPTTPIASAPGLSPTGVTTPGTTPSSPTAGGGNGASGGAVLSAFALATALGVAILPIFF